ncbi:putative transferase CAF17, mitochondrial [Phaeosphaeria sp. MPI-PUGE-AT-0046c]|nr:putative transferase CAF17, mitochondrial [Phaeosphaeria sp. MPI-PUGE-AT-0046c]
MGPTIPTIPLRNAAYICDSCLKSPRPLYNVLARRAYTIATPPHSQNASRQAPRRPEHKHGSRALKNAQSTKIRLHVSRRPYSTGSDPISATMRGTTVLSDRRLVSLSGPDTAKFLQGLITNNVDSTRLSPFYSAFLDARGRMLWDVFIWVWPELVAKAGHWACYIDVDAEEAESLRKHLKRHKLRSKVTIQEVPTQGPEGIRVWAAWSGAHEQVKETSEIAGFEDPRMPGVYRYLANADREELIEGIQPTPEKYYKVQRYMHGVAEGPREIVRETTLPMEANVDLSGGIDFKKGCYLGQELTIRTKHTGVVRKRILPVMFHPQHAESGGQVVFDESFEPKISPGIDVKALDETKALKKGRATGKIVAAIGNVGLATCRLENMTAMKISAEGGTFQPGMEFGIEINGQVVKVEPVLHNWFVERKETLWDTKVKKLSAAEQHAVNELD